MQIDIKPEDIDKFVKDAFMESAIGTKIRDSIDKSVKELFDNTWKNPITDFVKEEVKKLVGEYLRREDVQPKIMAAIAKGLSPETIELIISNAAHTLQKRINERNDE